MRATELALGVDPTLPEPLFLQVARGLMDAIRAGRLRPGDPLPGSRTLAASLGLHRNTVLSAWRELHAEGWLQTHPARGTFVAEDLPLRRHRRLRAAPPAGVAERAGYDLGPLAPPGPDEALPRGALALLAGHVDVGLVPREALSRALRRALRDHGAQALSYGDPQGTLALREALARWVSSRRGLSAGPEHVMITRGSQGGLDLVARTLLGPGDLVAVEHLGYRPAWEAFEAHGATVVPVAVDHHGLRTDLLPGLLRRGSLRAVYVTPHHQYPTTVTLSAPRRMELLAFARAHRVAVLEDDYDHEFHYGARPVLPLASADAHGVVVYVGTLSKLLAPGLRAGFVVAPEPLIARLARARRAVDRQGDQVLELALAELLEDGELERHARRARKVYHARRDAFVEALTGDLGGVLRVEAPAGGLALWAPVDPSVNVERWAERARALGVLVHTGRRFVFEGRAPDALRLGFAALPEARLREAVRRLARALSPACGA
ncbi:MAG: PLP-dependent aminotransferase family protein [Deltaproteobacteria bacterium]|nr:PLP-dependent aminotransferase family protein [Deltaproteobacteria bacterium]